MQSVFCPTSGNKWHKVFKTCIHVLIIKPLAGVRNQPESELAGIDAHQITYHGPKASAPYGRLLGHTGKPPWWTSFDFFRARDGAWRFLPLSFA
jgi:hypothetical protein